MIYISSVATGKRQSVGNVHDEGFLVVLLVNILGRNVFLSASCRKAMRVFLVGKSSDHRSTQGSSKFCTHGDAVHLSRKKKVCVRADIF